VLCIEYTVLWMSCILTAFLTEWRQWNFLSRFPHVCISCDMTDSKMVVRLSFYYFLVLRVYNGDHLSWHAGKLWFSTIGREVFPTRCFTIPLLTCSKCYMWNVSGFSDSWSLLDWQREYMLYIIYYIKNQQDAT